MKTYHQSWYTIQKQEKREAIAYLLADILPIYAVGIIMVIAIYKTLIK